MPENNTNKKRNVTGSYPGVTGSYKPTSAYPNSKSAPKQTPTRTESVKAASSKKQGFDFKLWFSQANVKAFLKQLRYYGLIVLASVLLTLAIINVANDLFAFIKPDESIVVSIEKDAGTKSIAKTLKKEGVIENPLVFRMYCKLKKADSQFKYGTYTLNSNMGYDQIISALRKTSVKEETFSLTVPAGSTQDDIAMLLTSVAKASAADVEYALNEHKYDLSFVKKLPDRRCRLEGYLAPGDYEFFVGESATNMVEAMLERFSETALTDANKKLISDSKYSTDEIVTLASLVQAECGSPDMYKGAAGVLYNRLKNDTDNFLQLSSSINYILPESKQTLTANDKKADSEYNTYMYSGLPTGPVCSPSAEAVAAVLAPEGTEYMYFISDGDKSYFSTTEQEHRANLEKVSAQAKGTDTIR